ncbi:pro-opiomelanocortin-like isoform 1-T1 [Fundulus diaphanus]
MIGSHKDVSLCVRTFACPWLKGYKAHRLVQEKQVERQKSLVEGTTERHTEERPRRKEIRRMRPLLLLVVAVVVGVVRAALSRCWELPSCQELSSESSMMDCIQLCGPDPHEMTTILGSVYLQSSPSSVFLSPSSFPSSSQGKNSYSMEHFRWGKPLGRKRHSTKIPTGRSVNGDSADFFPGELRWWELSRVKPAAEDEEQVAEEEAEQLSTEQRDTENIPYKMKHFRWSCPVASKRYGGFMKSWKGHSKGPLVTLFRNVINKGEEEKRAM